MIRLLFVQGRSKPMNTPKIPGNFQLILTHGSTTVVNVMYVVPSCSAYLMGSMRGESRTVSLLEETSIQHKICDLRMFYGLSLVRFIFFLFFARKPHLLLFHCYYTSNSSYMFMHISELGRIIIWVWVWQT